MNTGTFLLSLALVPALAYAIAHLPLLRRFRPAYPPLLSLLVLAFVLRALFLVLFPDPGGDPAYDAVAQGAIPDRPNPFGDLRYDVVSNRIVADLVRDGEDVYAGTDRYPYLPFQMYIFAFSAQLEDWFGPDFFSWLRWPNILADLGILVLIYWGSLKLGRSKSTAFWLAFLWAVHPVSIFTSALHGQFDSISAFFALLAWYLLRFWPGYRGALLGGLALGLGVLDKTWPALFIPVFLLLASGWRGKAIYLAAVAAVPALALLIYSLAIGTSFDLIQMRVFGYEGVSIRFGYTFAFRTYMGGFIPDGWNAIAADNGRVILLVALALVGVIVIPRRDAMTSATALIATFYAAGHGFGSNYLLWIIPFALMSGQVAMLGAYSAVAIPGFLIYYWGTCGLICPGRLADVREYWSLQLVWPVAIVWMFREVARALSLPDRFVSLKTGLGSAVAPAAGERT